MSSEVDYARIYACLHKALIDMENTNATIRSPFSELSARECVRAHYLLDTLDNHLRVRWEADGSPDLFNELRPT